LAPDLPSSPTRRSSDLELFVISDLQAAGLPPARPDSAKALPPNVRFYVLPVGETQRPENLALTGARVRGGGGFAAGGLSFLESRGPKRTPPDSPHLPTS